MGKFSKGDYVSYDTSVILKQVDGYMDVDFRQGIISPLRITKKVLMTKAGYVVYHMIDPYDGKIWIGTADDMHWLVSDDTLSDEENAIANRVYCKLNKIHEQFDLPF